MRIDLAIPNNFEIAQASDLEAFIPEALGGRVISYGQGEGQFALGMTVWGVYFDDFWNYYLQYEEWQCSWNALVRIVRVLLLHLDEKFGEIVATVSGIYDNQADF